MSKNRMIAATATLLVAVAALAGPAAAEHKPLAVVDSQRIAEEYEAARDAQEQYQKFLRELELEVAEREKVLTAMAEEIESQKLLLGEDALATKVQAFEQKRAEYFQFRESIDQRAEAEYEAKITPILDQIKTIVERIGKGGMGSVYLARDPELDRLYGPKRGVFGLPRGELVDLIRGIFGKS